MRAKWIVLAFTVITVVILGWDQFGSHPDRAIAVQLFDPDGKNTGVIVVQPVARQRVLITANVRNLTPGFHGFHIHETGLCEVTEAGNFLTSNGHFDLHAHDHGEHSGDLPVLEVDESGRAFLAVHTTRFHFEDLFDADGSAFIIHADGDNVANIPERYGGADETTRANGDAGDRVACGVIAPPQ